MIYSRLWERYFVRQFLGTFCILFFGFFALYVLLDYSSHTGTFHKNQIHFQWQELVSFYLCEFVNRLDVLLPFAILVATIKTLCQLNANHELVALLSGGVNMRTLLRPFFGLGLIFTAVMYLNTQFFVPIATTNLKSVSEEGRKLKKKKLHEPMVEHLALADDTKLVYQNFDQERQRFYDAYWVKSYDEIYRIKYLYPYSSVPRGEYIEYLKRDETGSLMREATYAARDFSEMRFNKKKLIETTTLPEQLSLTSLWEKITTAAGERTDKQVQLLTTFYVRLAMPWLCLLAVIGPAPFCVNFSRTLPVFLIYAVAAFIFIAFYLVIESAEVMAKRQVFSPFAGIAAPFLLFTLPILWNYVRALGFRRG